MSDVLDRFRLLADDFSARVSEVPDTAWGKQSPCPEWTARDVVAHVTGNARRFASLVEAAEDVPVGPDEDVAAAWAEARGKVESALADPDKAGKIVPSPFGDMPFEAIIGRFMCTDTLVHTWDLARAVGLDERINADAAAHAHEGLAPMDAMLRGPGRFGPAVTPPDGADAQTKLLCFLGREV